jgi:hypothetical protein
MKKSKGNIKLFEYTDADGDKLAIEDSAGGIFASIKGDTGLLLVQLTPHALIMLADAAKRWADVLNRHHVSSLSRKARYHVDHD